MEKRTGRERGFDNRSRTSQMTNGSTRAQILEATDGTMKFNFLMFFGVLFGGIVAFILDNILYGLLYGKIPNILLFGLIIMIFTAGILAGSLLSTVRYNIDAGRAFIFMIACTAVMFLIGILFEFIYELDFTSEKPSAVGTASVSDYIFCIDDSGSMDTNDPSSQRYVALDNILNQLDGNNNVGVIRFAEKAFANCDPKALDSEQKQNIEEIINGQNDIAFGGGTNFEAPLQKALKMYKRLGISGRNQVVVLLSDGESYLDVDQMTEKYNDAGIIICSIFLGSGDMPEVLTDLSSKTGGISVSVADADDLVSTFDNIVSSTNKISENRGQYQRFLWNARTFSDQNNVLAIIERILFFMIFGLIYGVTFNIIFGVPLKKQRFISIAEGLLCGVIFEGGFALGLSDIIVRLAMLLMALIFSRYMTKGVVKFKPHGEMQKIVYKDIDLDCLDGKEINSRRNNDTARNYNDYGRETVSPGRGSTRQGNASMGNRNFNRENRNRSTRDRRR